MADNEIKKENEQEKKDSENPEAVSEEQAIPEEEIKSESTDEAIPEEVTSEDDDDNTENDQITQKSDTEEIGAVDTEETPSTNNNEQSTVDVSKAPETKPAPTAVTRLAPHQQVDTNYIPVSPQSNSGIQPVAPQKKGGVAKVIIASIVGALIGGGIIGAVAYNAFDNMNTGSTSNVISSALNEVTTSAADDEDATLAEQVAEKCLPSVVSVYTYQSTGTTYSFSSGTSSDSSSSNSSTETMSGLGSGVILSSDGYIVTNAHVISGANTVKVEVDGVPYDAEIVGNDTSTDIAVLKIDATGLTPIEFADSDTVNVGSWCMAIGSPYGYEKTVTTGIVSAVDRAMTLSDSNGSTVYVGMLQTDAAINSGNSGGALVNEDGQLIGINSVIASTSGSSAGIGFAISSDYVLDAVTQLIENGYVVHPQLGVSIVQSSTGTGATIISIVSDSAAEEAGLQIGDIITSVDGESVSDSEDVVIAVRLHSVGDTITVEYTRNGVANTVEVTLKSDVDTTGTTASSSSNTNNKSDNSKSSNTTSNDETSDSGSNSNTSSDGDSEEDIQEETQSILDKLLELFGGNSSN